MYSDSMYLMTVVLRIMNSNTSDYIYYMAKKLRQQNGTEVSKFPKLEWGGHSGSSGELVAILRLAQSGRWKQKRKQRKL